MRVLTITVENNYARLQEADGGGDERTGNLLVINFKGSRNHENRRLE
jgi:hypothetical protein